MATSVARQDSTDWATFIVPGASDQAVADQPAVLTHNGTRGSFGEASSFSDGSEDAGKREEALQQANLQRFRLYTAEDEEADYEQMEGSNAGSQDDEEPLESAGDRDSAGRDSTVWRRPSADASTRSMAIIKLMSQSRGLRMLPSRLQMLLTREMKEEIYAGPGGVTLYSAAQADASVEQIMLVDSGFVDVMSPQADGSELLVGRAGSGTMLGALHTLGITNTCLLTVRRSGDAGPACEQLVVFAMSGQSLEAMRAEFEDELNSMRRHAMREFKRFIVESFCANSSVPFFRPFAKEVVTKLLRKSDLKVLRAGEDLFVEDDPAHTMAILCAGHLEVFIREKYISSITTPGACLGESSLADGLGRRAATVRCSRDRDAIVCILEKDTFVAMLDAYPEERRKLQEQVLTKLTQAGLQNIFPKCSKDFLRWLTLKADTMELLPGESRVTTRQRASMLLITLRGSAELTFRNGHSFVLQKGELHGLAEALTLKEAVGYTVKSSGGGSLLCLSSEVMDRALVYFPSEVEKVLSVAGIEDLPPSHPVFSKQDTLWELVQPLFARALLAEECDSELCKAFRTALTVQVFERNARMTEIGAEPGHMVLVLDGTFTRTYADEQVTFHMTAPCVLDEEIVAGIKRRSTSTCCSTTPCLAWLLPVTQANSLRRSDLRLFRLFEHSWKAWRGVESTLASRNKTRRAFQLFHPRVTDIILEHAHVQVFLPGEALMVRGDDAECMYVILQGTAELDAPSKEIASLEPGSVCGESCLLGALLREADVRATAMAVCLVVHKDLVTLAMKLQAAEGPSRVPERRRSESVSMTSAVSVGQVSSARPSLRRGPSGIMRRATWAAQQGPTRHSRGSTLRRARTSTQPSLAISFDLDNISASSGASSSSKAGSEASMLSGTEEEDESEKVARPGTPPTLRGSTTGGTPKAGSRAHSEDGKFLSVNPHSLDEADALRQGHIRPYRAHLSSQRCLQSALQGTAMPAMPEAGAHLYRTPKDAKAKLQNAFREALPPVHLAATELHQSQRSVVRVALAPEKCVGKPGRKLRASPTYTEPISPRRPLPMKAVQGIQPPRSQRRPQQQPQPRQKHRHHVVAVQLHDLASSLLRINSKSQLRQHPPGPASDALPKQLKANLEPIASPPAPNESLTTVGDEKEAEAAAPQASGASNAPDLNLWLRHSVVCKIERGDFNPRHIGGEKQDVIGGNAAMSSEPQGSDHMSKAISSDGPRSVSFASKVVEVGPTADPEPQPKEVQTSRHESPPDHSSLGAESGLETMSNASSLRMAESEINGEEGVPDDDDGAAESDEDIEGPISSGKLATAVCTLLFEKIALRQCGSR